MPAHDTIILIPTTMDSLTTSDPTSAAGSVTAEAVGFVAGTAAGSGGRLLKDTALAERGCVSCDVSNAMLGGSTRSGALPAAGAQRALADKV